MTDEEAAELRDGLTGPAPPGTAPYTNVTEALIRRGYLVEVDRADVPEGYDSWVDANTTHIGRIALQCWRLAKALHT